MKNRHTLYLILTITLLFNLIAVTKGYSQFTYVSPLPGSQYHYPQTSIILRNLSLIDEKSVHAEGILEIYGSVSGIHSWKAHLASDNKTVVIRPTTIFSSGETVFVVVNPVLRNQDGTIIEGISFNFSIRELLTPDQQKFGRQLNQQSLSDADYSGTNEDSGTRENIDSLPTYTININNNPAPGQIFFANQNDIFEDTNSFTTIIENDGALVFARDCGRNGHDFKINKNGYLTYFNYDSIQWMMMDSNYNIIDSFQCTNGLEEFTNGHDFIIFPDGHYFLIAYDLLIIDLSQVVTGGQPDAFVQAAVIQEFDVNKDLVFEWRAIDHFEIDDVASTVPLTTLTVDWTHCNAVEEDYDGNIIISCRNFSEITKIDIETGDIIWRLGGENNQFAFINDPLPEHFSYQHDIRRLNNGNILLFNNGNFLPVEKSSPKEYQLDEVNKTATLVWKYEHPDVNGHHVFGRASGSAHRLSNGNTLVSWGFIVYGIGIPSMTEVDPGGNIVWEMTFDQAGQKSYRVHKYLWQPCARPTSYTMNSNFISPTKVKLSWGKASGAGKYQVDYRPDGVTAWSKVFTTSTKVNLTGLIPGTVYEWRVRSVCRVNGRSYSAYTQSAFFTQPQKWLNNNSEDMAEAIIYPNPSNGNFTIDLPMTEQEMVSVTIFNLFGQVVYLSNENSGEKAFHSEIHQAHLPQGTYFVELKTKYHHQVYKIIVE